MTTSSPSLSRLDLLAAILLGAGSVGAAAGGWLASLWSGQQAGRYATAGVTLSRANTDYLEAQASFQALGLEALRDDLMYAEYRAAQEREDADDVEYFEEQLSEATQVLLAATGPAEEAAAVAKHEAEVAQELARLAKKRADSLMGMRAADAQLQDGERANEFSDRFGLVGVLMSLAVFFGGLSPLVHANRLKVAYLVLGLALWCGGMGVGGTTPLPF